MSDPSILDPVTSSVEVARMGDILERSVTVPIGGSVAALPSLVNTGEPQRDWLLSTLRGGVPTYAVRPKRAIRTIELFCGSGGLSLGARWAIEAVGFRSVALLAADIDPDAVDVHAYNLNPRRSHVGSVRDLFDPTLLDTARRVSDVTPSDVVAADWIQDLGPADVIIGGPPCQGHSNLNNRTRRADARNELYRWMALAALATSAKVVVIENVPTVKADAGDVVGRTMKLLNELGFVTAFDDVVAADAIGVPQTRRRHFLVAIHSSVLDDGWERASARIGRSVGFTTTAIQAIGDLQDPIDGEPYDQSSVLSPENRARAHWLHEHGEFDLPDRLRPECHQDGSHNYGAVYGRMHGDRPASTLSTGFLSPGRGRYVHPTRPRGLSPHEGARLQGFPDGFRFIGVSGRVPKRTVVSRMIGDAVPPPLAFHVILGALAMLRADTFNEA